MIRKIPILALFFLLISLATYELIAVNNIITKLETQVDALYEQVEHYKDDLSPCENLITKVKTNWDNNEDGLCVIFNHKDLSNITDTLTKLQTLIFNNDYDNAIVEVALLKEYSQKNKHIMGFNIQNLL